MFLTALFSSARLDERHGHGEKRLYVLYLSNLMRAAPGASMTWISLPVDRTGLLINDMAGQGRLEGWWPAQRCQGNDNITKFGVCEPLL